MNPEVRYYLSVFIRRLPLFLLVALSISSSAVALAVILPTVFTANAVLLVERSQISEDMAKSTVVVDTREQLQIMQQRLMTRANLIEIARQFNVYADVAVMTPDQIVDEMRIDTVFRSTSGRDQATLLTVIFNGRTAQISAQVVNEYVTRILAENARQRLRQAQDTLSFFEQEVDRLAIELDVESARILKFQNENVTALPGTLNFRMQRAALLQEQLSQISRDTALFRDQRERLIKVFEAGGGLSANGLVNQTPEQRRLEELKTELTELRTVYSETSPRVITIRQRVEALEAQLAEQARSVNEAQGADTPTGGGTALDLQLAEIDSRLKFLDQESERINEELVDLEDSIRRTPNNSIQLEARQRAYDNVQLQYNRANENLSAAVTGKEIESLNKGERITIIEQAVPPDEPSKPNRPLIAAGGTAFGLGAATFFVVMLEVLNKAIRRPIDITNGLGITPLATVPYIATRGEKARKRVLIMLALLFVLAGIPALLYAVHYQFMPLDLILDKIVDKLRF